MDEVEIFLDRFETLAREVNKKERAISLDATGSADRIRNVRRRHALPKREALEAVAAYFGTSIDYLLGRSDDRGSAMPTPTEPPAPPVDGIISLSESRQSYRNVPRAQVPVWGTALGHDLKFDEDGSVIVEETIMHTDEAIRYVYRPDILIGVEAYGLIIQGDSMFPRYKQGEIALVHPLKPYGRGDDVILQLQDDNVESDEGPQVISVLVKEFVRKTATYYEVKQYQPERTFRIPVSRVRYCHRILTPAEMLGL